VLVLSREMTSGGHSSDAAAAKQQHRLLSSSQLAVHERICRCMFLSVDARVRGGDDQVSNKARKLIENQPTLCPVGSCNWRRATYLKAMASKLLQYKCVQQELRTTYSEEHRHKSSST
jgi:hypothetical protein